MKVDFELNEHRVLIAIMSGFFAVFVLHAAYPGLFDYWPKNSADLSGWIQGIGTIAAIGAGFVVANRTQRHQIELQKFKVEESIRVNSVSGYRILSGAFTSSAAMLSICKDKVMPGANQSLITVLTYLEEVRANLDVRSDLRVTDIYFIENAQLVRTVILNLHRHISDDYESKAKMTDKFFQHMQDRFKTQSDRCVELGNLARDRVTELATPDELESFHRSRADVRKVYKLGSTS